MAQYLNWVGAGPIPYPPPHPKGTWTEYQLYTAKFYENPKAMALYEQVIQKLITRKNTVNGRDYAQDPTIMTWQLANEPRAMRNAAAFNNWIRRSARLIKSLAPHHLVTTGSEGETPAPLWHGMNFVENHSDPAISYTTAHIWAQNFGWYDPTKPASYDEAMKKVKAYIADHVTKTKKLGKPLVIEEFGLARDNGSFDPRSATATRDRYFEVFFSEVMKSAVIYGALAGVNFWAWGGEGLPAAPFGGHWKSGDPLTGDPPHEPQGWYSVYEHDTSTLKAISKYTKGLRFWRWFGL